MVFGVSDRGCADNSGTFTVSSRRSRQLLT
jgi:hypothetical protein